MKPPFTGLLRGFFGLLLLITAVGKLLDNRGFAEILATYQFYIPEPLLLPLGLAISLGELGMALAIFAGVQLPRMAQLTILLHAGYTALAALTNLRGLDLTNCGCFGVFWARPMTWLTVAEDVVLTLMAIAFYAGVRPLARARPGNASRELDRSPGRGALEHHS